jgi:hypothetical protein
VPPNGSVFLVPIWISTISGLRHLVLVEWLSTTGRLAQLI